MEGNRYLTTIGELITVFTGCNWRCRGIALRNVWFALSDIRSLLFHDLQIKHTPMERVTFFWHEIKGTTSTTKHSMQRNMSIKLSQEVQVMM